VFSYSSFFCLSFPGLVAFGLPRLSRPDGALLPPPPVGFSSLFLTLCLIRCCGVYISQIDFFVLSLSFFFGENSLSCVPGAASATLISPFPRQSLDFFLARFLSLVREEKHQFSPFFPRATRVLEFALPLSTHPTAPLRLFPFHEIKETCFF